VDEHLWHFELGTAAAADTPLAAASKRKKARVCWKSRQYCGPQGVMVEIFDEGQRFAASASLSSLNMSESSRLRFTYDYGTTTTLFLRVERLGEMTVCPQQLPRVVLDSFPATS
jgi:hypothetical protein